MLLCVLLGRGSGGRAARGGCTAGCRRVPLTCWVHEHVQGRGGGLRPVRGDARGIEIGARSHALQEGTFKRAHAGWAPTSAGGNTVRFQDFVVRAATMSTSSIPGACVHVCMRVRAPDPGLHNPSQHTWGRRSGFGQTPRIHLDPYQPPLTSLLIKMKFILCYSFIRWK